MTHPQNHWSSAHSNNLYRVDQWGEGHFGINEAGHVVALPCADGPEIDLTELVSELEKSGLRLPTLVRFPGILSDRVSSLCTAFDDVRAERDYAGTYTAIYPIKVNQQRSVVEHILHNGHSQPGLEAGSKPELLAVLGLPPLNRPIVCNGYKDRAFIRLVMAGVQLGHTVYLVVEKLSELDDILALAKETGIMPRLGLRARLASVATGHWQNTGGDRAKFGLTASQLLTAVERLRTAGYTQAIRMLHVHVGSQVANADALRTAMAEVANLYRALRESAVPLECVDVGGGLAVDYEGRGDTGFCSMNYRVSEYAEIVIGALAHVCHQYTLLQPAIFSESGRALTAHHAVLLTDIIDEEVIDQERVDNSTDTAEAAPNNPLATCRAAVDAIETAQQAFIARKTNLEQRANAEYQGYAQLQRAAAHLNADNPEHQQLLAELEDKLADKYYGNFSVFQSVPDAWALNQVFPILPLQRLDEKPNRRVRLCDLTCDSDGHIDSTLPLHERRPGERYLLGLFMVGAYQENLGDMHNLFGNTDTVNVETDGQSWYLTEPTRGDAAYQLLEAVHFQPQHLRDAYRRKIDAAAMDTAHAEECAALLEKGLKGYTYLLD